MENIVHRAYKRAANLVHYEWEYLTFEDAEGTEHTIPIRNPIQYIKFEYPDGSTAYMPLQALLADGLGGLTFGTATEAIKLEKSMKK